MPFSSIGRTLAAGLSAAAIIAAAALLPATVANAEPVHKVGNLAGSPHGSDSVELTWDAPQDDGESYAWDYTVTAVPEGGTEPLIDFEVLWPGGWAGIDALDGELVYVFTVTPHAGDLVGEPSSVTLTSATPATAPDFFWVQWQYSADDPALRAEWQAARGNGRHIIEYRVDARRGAASEWFQVASVPPMQTFAMISDLELGGDYDFRVVAVTSLGNGAPSDIASATYGGEASPPESLIATAGDSAVTVSWEPPAVVAEGREISHYEVLWSQEGWEATLLATVETGTSYRITGLRNSVPTFVQVRAWTARGDDVGIGSIASVEAISIGLASSIAGFETLRDRHFTPGERFTIGASGLPVGGLLVAELRSDPVRIGSAVVDVEGGAALDLHIPEDAPVGEHILVLTFTAAGTETLTASTPVIVAAAARADADADAAPPRSLAATGADGQSPTALGALALVLLGTVLALSPRIRAARVRSTD